MTAPLSPEHTWLILEASRTLDERQTDNFVDHVAHTLGEILDPTTEDVQHAIACAQRALRLSEAH
jgi:hypothetical protein